MKTTLLSKKARGYVYGVAVAAMPVLVATHVVKPEASALALPLLLALLNLRDPHDGDRYQLED